MNVVFYTVCTSPSNRYFSYNYKLTLAIIVVLLEKLIIAKLVRKSSAFYETWSFITVSTRAHHWALFWATWIQSTYSHPVPLRSILILSCACTRRCPHFFSVQVFGLQCCVHFSFAPIHATCPVHITLFDVITVIFLKSKNYYAPRYVCLSSPVLGPDILVSSLFSAFSVFVLSLGREVSHPYKARVKMNFV
jgi:hypothetical protein